MYDTFMLSSGVLWTAVYVMIIRRGFYDKTYGMPLAALCANISWEFIFSFIYQPPPPQIYVNMVWFCFDLTIVYQYSRFGLSEIKNLSKPVFVVFSILSIIVGFCLVHFITIEFNDYQGAYAAFGQNLMMSILFVLMLYNRNSIRGQSLYIAIAKCLGTIAPSLAFYLYVPRFHGSLLMNFMYVSIFVFDLLYIVIVYNKCREEGINPWKRI